MTSTGPWTVVGRAVAGPAGRRDPLAPGLAVEIATGAVVPPGTVAVVPYEHTTSDGDRVRGTAIAGRNVRRTGEDVPVGTDLVPAGSPVTPAVVGLAAAVGLDALPVRPRPAIALLVTGDELVAGRRRRRTAWSGTRWGRRCPAGCAGSAAGRCRPSGCVTPTADDVAKAVEAAGGDVVVTSGGVGGGPEGPGRAGAAGARRRAGRRPGRLPAGRPAAARAAAGRAAAGRAARLPVRGAGRGADPARAAAGRNGRAGAAGPADGAPGRRRAVDGQPAGAAGRPTPAPTRILPVRRRPDGSVESVGLDRPGSLWGAALADAFAVVPPRWRDDPVALLDPPR